MHGSAAALRGPIIAVAFNFSGESTITGANYRIVSKRRCKRPCCYYFRIVITRWCLVEPAIVEGLRRDECCRNDDVLREREKRVRKGGGEGTQELRPTEYYLQVSSIELNRKR